MDIELLKKVMAISDEDALVKTFGKTLAYPVHQGLIYPDDPDLIGVWLWQFSNYEVATIDKGLGKCQIVMIEKKQQGIPLNIIR